jgi:polyphenol oxidase
MSVAWLTPQWPAPPAVRALSSFRSGGVSEMAYASLNLAAHVGDESAAVDANRQRLMSSAGLPAQPVWLTQVHGAQVADLDAGAVQGAADAAFTRQPGRVCAILAADCLPILLAADSGDVVAAAHAGWRGLAAGVIEAVVGALKVNPAELLAWLGPAIGPERFEVGAEVREALLRADPEGGGAFATNARGRFMADLPQLARRRLVALGLTRIYGSDECTHSQPDRYFSHRRDGRCGRQATLIWLEQAQNR